MSEPGSGDKLARGANRATYGMPSVTQEQWDKIWEQDGLPSTEDLDKVAEEQEVKDATK